MSRKAGVQNLIEIVGSYLDTYRTLGCLICFAHSCEHGDFEKTKARRCFAMSMRPTSFNSLAIRRLVAQAKAKLTRELPPTTIVDPKKTATEAAQPCKNECFRAYDMRNEGSPTNKWTEGELNLLRSMFLTLGDGKIECQCTVATLLDRRCWDVYKQMKELKLVLPALPAA